MTRGVKKAGCVYGESIGNLKCIISTGSTPHEAYEARLVDILETGTHSSVDPFCSLFVVFLTAELRIRYVNVFSV